jgi:4-amino-4-deoxy-L-arabinose transferase-like glycosyltransferase
VDRESGTVPDGHAADGVQVESERRDTALAVLVLAAYGLAHLAMRVAVSDTAELDEAEQLVLTQTLALGYDDQPPLYTWIQALAFRVLGPGILALALVKNALLFGTHLFVFLSARRVLGRVGPALVTSLALYLLPQIAWESRRDLTNSVLATTVAAATFHLVLSLRQAPAASRHLLLGALLGAGLLSRYSFGVFAAALLGAARSVGPRPAGAARRLALALALGAVLFLPHGVWLFREGPADPWELSEKLGIDPHVGSIRAAWLGLGALAWAGARFLAPLAVAAAAFLGGPLTRRPVSPDDSGIRPLIERFFVIAIALLALGVLAFGMTRFRDRWLQPILFLAPLYVMVRAAGAGTPPGRLRGFAVLAFLASLATLAAPALQVWLGPRLGQYSRLNVAFEQLAGKIRQAGFEEGTILAGDVFLAGNLRLAFPRARVLTPELPAAGVMEGQPILLVWRSYGSEDPPAAIAELANRLARLSLDSAPPPSHAEAPFGGVQQRPYRIGFLVLTPLVRATSLR